VTRHVDDATKDAWHPYKLEPQGDPHMTIVGARTDGLTGVRCPFRARDTKTSVLGAVVPFALLDQASHSPGELGPSLSPTG